MGTDQNDVKPCLSWLLKYTVLPFGSGRMLSACGAAVDPASDRWVDIQEQAALIVSDAEREIAQPADLSAVRSRAATLREDAALLRGDAVG